MGWHVKNGQGHYELFIYHPIRSDNGPEFIAYAINDWLEKAAIKTIYITPGSPWENGHIESLHDKLRDECLNRELFGSLLEARVILESWRMEYNDLRPHSSLGYLSPSDYMRKKQSIGGFAPPNPAPLAAAGVRGELGATAHWRQENKTDCGSSVMKCPTYGVRSPGVKCLGECNQRSEGALAQLPEDLLTFAPHIAVAAYPDFLPSHSASFLPSSPLFDEEPASSRDLQKGCPTSAWAWDPLENNAEVGVAFGRLGS